ncbi:hypothetical protein BGW36DRAFT_375518 [Talaromyces proteolyticus]|uniref:FAD-binding domain-containing protein n=1 Tax=Talaromyces proteolyticus TaxID=1131652 RepID=A0AAD4KUE2_9EURO|nr:uncharacterized protein BGW36DRAFT_375518 [Talaromyces proteolyticus]KAH8701068.1 hypothetical protein BGW36DRAFT_375518 [Talaromyces proteolyticus]
MPTRLESNRPLRVAIIGAGPGGLVLAQLLRDDPGFEVTVYERGEAEGDETSSLTGYRILITPELLDSLRKHLPADVQMLLEKAIGVSQKNGNRLGMMDTMCRLICRVDLAGMRSLCSVSRWKLRKALLSGSREFVKFGRVFTSYEVDGSKGVKVSFSDGESIHCDLLVGADGAGSRVRKQLLPDSSRSSTGVTTIYFKAPYTPETEAMIPWASGIMAMAPRRSMVVAYYKNPAKPYGPYDLNNIDPEDSFLMVGMGCYTNEFFNQDKHPDELTPEELKDECLNRARGWHPLLQALIAITVPNSVFVSHIKTQDPIEPWKTGQVTILGDAAHSMTPFLGQGATNAIVDAMTLAEKLKWTEEKEKETITAGVREYESSMLKRGNAAVKNSLYALDLTFAWGNTPWRAWFRNLALSFWDILTPHPANLVEPFPVSYSESNKKGN